MTREELQASAARLVDLAKRAGLRTVTAESCTGGLVAAFLTDVAGSSAVFERGFVTYSNEAKAELLGVPRGMLETHGAVSKEVARAMADGALLNARAELSVSVTGIAGPGGGSEAKPVGLVYFAASNGRVTRHREERFGDRGREAIRLSSVAVALAMLESLVAETDASSG